MTDTSSAWPQVSIAGAYRMLTAPGAPFEMESREINGRKVRAYKGGFPHLRAIFENSARFADREYLVFEGERLTYGDHYRAVAALARAFADRYGIAKGDRIAIAMRNFPEWAIAFWAAAISGAVVTPLNAWGTGDDLQYGITNSGAKIVVADGERLERLAPLRHELAGARVIAVRAPREEFSWADFLEDLIGPADRYGAIEDTSLPDVTIDPEDDATIFYTSGTTGRPKGAYGTHRNIVTNILNVDFTTAFAAVRRGEPVPPNNPDPPQKTGLLPAPFFHVTGCHSNLVPAMAKGRKIVLMYKWNPERALELIEQEKINTSGGVPSMAWQMLDSADFARRDTSTIEGISYGGAAAAPELTLRVVRMLPKVKPRQAYGATETSSVSTANSAEDYQRKPDSVGLAAPVCDIRIVREDGREALVGERGEIWIAGPNVVKGYWNNPEATASAFVDGWYRTGDVGKVDEEGFIYVLDRIKDMLIRGGENIYCVEIESAIYTLDAVLEAAVVGLPHKVLGEEVGAIVQRRAGSDLNVERLKAHLATVLPAHKLPKFIDIRDEELPKNASGKVLKRELRDELAEAFAAEQGLA